MNDDMREVLIGLEWFLLGLFFLRLSLGTWRLAREIDGTLWTWPVAGHYLVALACLSFAVVSFDVVRLRFEPGFLEPYWSSAGGDAAASSEVVVIRAVPIVLLAWIDFRVLRGGLIRGGASSRLWDGTERRQQVRRKDDRERMEQA